MGSELYVYFEVESSGSSRTSCELAGLRRGGGSLGGEGGQVVARLDAASKVKRARRPSSGSTRASCTSSIPDGPQPRAEANSYRSFDLSSVEDLLAPFVGPHQPVALRHDPHVDVGLVSSLEQARFAKHRDDREVVLLEPGFLRLPPAT